MVKTIASPFAVCDVLLRDMKHCFGTLLMLSMLVGGCDVHAAESKKDRDNPSTKGRDTLVILGASYAKGWAISDLDGVVIVNRGTAGDETRAMLSRFQKDVVSVRPKAVLIWGFINDVFRAPRDQIETTLGQTRGNIIAMINLATRAGIKPILATEVTITNPAGARETLARWVGALRGKQGYHEYVNRHVRDTNVWIRQLAAERRIPVLNFETILADPNGERQRQFATEDGSHLSADAYDALTTYARGKLGAALAH